MLRRCSIAVCALVLLVILSAAVVADEAKVFQGKTTSVAAFKNGLGFFIRQGDAQLNNGWGVSDTLPKASLGTYWIGSPKKGVTVERLVAAQEEIASSVPADSPWELLNLNVGKTVTFGYYGQPGITGTILSVPDAQSTSDTSAGVSSRPSGSLVLIQTVQGVVAISRDSVNQIVFQEKPNTETPIRKTVDRIKFQLSGAKDSAPITLAYMQKGITWSPAYLIELIDDDKARITMQAMLMNDVEDIDGADVQFVVGYPNFMFSDIQTPLAPDQSVAQFIQALSSGRSELGLVGSVGTQSVAYNYGYISPNYDRATGGPAGPAGFGYNTGNATPGQSEEDLYFYEMKNVSLKKGERAYDTLFTAEVPYSHQYQWDIPDMSRIQQEAYARSSSQSQQTQSNQIWHKLVLADTTKYPWTTAPAMLVSNSRPIAQDVLGYTPKGDKGEVKITLATDIKGDASETERSREDATKEFGYRTTKVTVDGKLLLHNYKTMSAPVTVKKTILGSVESASDDGNIRKTAVALQRMNPSSVIEWKVDLKPGEEKVLTYTYVTYTQQ